jgi:hypothetical protein
MMKLRDALTDVGDWINLNPKKAVLAFSGLAWLWGYAARALLG